MILCTEKILCTQKMGTSLFTQKRQIFCSAYAATPLLADMPQGFASSHLVSVVTRSRNCSSCHSPLPFPEASKISKPQE